MEALIDIRVTLPTEIDLARLKTFPEPFAERFPESKLRSSAAARIAFNDQAAPVVTSEGPTPDGYFFRGPGGDLIAQARLDGFTLSKLKPYDSWMTFCPQFVELWNRYIAVAHPLKITRVALRYINRIELPVAVDFKKYLLTVPEIAPGIPQSLPALLMRLVIPSPSGNIAIVTETAGDTPSDPGMFPLIFDIDVFRDVDMSTGDAALWSIIRDLRLYKNTIFFNSLTPTALEMYK